MNATPFRFLDLPGELRNKIYEVMLVRPSINITARHINVPPGEFLRNRIPFKCRKKLSDFGDRDWRNETTYEAVSDFQIYFNMFLVSRQVYREVASIFYSQNTFSFVPNISTRGTDAAMAMGIGRYPLALGACEAFIHDRSAFALTHIKSLELSIMEGDYETKGWECTCCGLDVDTAQIINVVAIVNRDLTALEHLSLHISDSGPEPMMVYFQLSRLFELRKVKSLSIRWANNGRANCGKGMVEFAGLLRENLLENAQHLGKENIRISSRHLAIQTEGGLWKRLSDRLFVVECHDDAEGRTLLPPRARLAPLFRGISEHLGEDEVLGPDCRFRYLAMVRRIGGGEIGNSDVSDYDESDGGDNDSLNDLQIGT